MEDSTGKESICNKIDADRSSTSMDNGIENMMESMTKITLGGVAGTMIGLSLEKRLGAMKLTTAEGIAAVARRKRGRTTNHQSNLIATWALSCLVFCTIIETSRLISPSTWILNQMEETKYRSTSRDIKTTKSPLITIADYSIGGSIAGATFSLGRRINSSQTYTVMKFAKPRTFSGYLIGFALGGLAGTFQAAIDYGTSRLEIANDLEL